MGVPPTGTNSAATLGTVGRRKPVLVAVFIAMVLLGFGIAPLGAHTDVWQRSPEAGLAYGGTIDEVQISFIAAVSSSEITLLGPDDEPIELSATRLESADRIAVAEFPELTEPGRYVVTHTELATDGDTQTAAFQFFLDPASENRAAPLLGEDGPNWPLLGIVAGAVLVLAGLFWPGRTAR